MTVKRAPRPNKRVKPGAQTRHVTARIAEDDYRAVENAAQSAGLTVSAYLRVSAIGTATADPETRNQVLAAGTAIATPDPGQLELTAEDIESNTFALTTT
jgi:flagellar basal body rod protein FlgF